MRPVRNAFLDFQLTALFDKIIPIPLRAKDTSEISSLEKVIIRRHLNRDRFYLRKPSRSISVR
jgi:hypothetical protein